MKPSVTISRQTISKPGPGIPKLNSRLKERRSDSSIGWAGIQPPHSSPPPQHFRPRLRGVFFPRDKSGPACHMSTIHRKAFSDFDSARAADGHTRPSQRSGNPRRASRRISCGRSSLPRRNRKIVTSSLSSRRANHSIEVAARDNSPRSLWIREK